MPRSIKQQWVFERCFRNKGSLAGMGVRLRQIAGDSSTLSYEAGLLYQASTIIDKVFEVWDTKEKRAGSLKQFTVYKQPKK